MKSKVSGLYELYRLLVGRTEPSGRPIIEGAFYFSPLPRSCSSNLWVEIVPDIHEPQGQCSRSASLRVFDPAEHTLAKNACPYVELQAFELPDEKPSPDLVMFRRHGSESSNVLTMIMDKLQTCFE